MKLLVENNRFKLFYEPNRVNRYMVYKRYDGNDFTTMVAQSSIFSKKLKSYFTTLQVNTAIAKVHAMKYVGNKFKT